MTTYYTLGVLVAALTVSCMAVTAIVYLVRKNDKIASLTNKIPEIRENTKRIEVIEARFEEISTKLIAAFREIDANRDRITYTGEQISEHTKRMEESNGLILKALTGLVNAAINGNDKDNLTSVKDMLERETVVVTKRVIQ